MPAAPPPGLMGRDREWSALVRAVEGASAGRGGVVLLAGEPGIGKTRLLAEALRLAADGGAVTSVATCVRSGRPWWPWRQVLRPLGGADVFDAERPEAGARAELFEAVLDRLAMESGSGRRGLVLGFDDLQWADASSLRLLAMVGRAVTLRPVLLVGTYRDIEVGDDHPLRATIGELGAAASTVTLDGLDVDAVAALLSESGADPGVAATVRDRTRGNPFFVREVAPMVASGAERPADVPVAVVEVVRNRIVEADPEARRLLEAAAVAWTASDLALLADALGVAVVDLVAPAEDLCRARLLERVGAGYGFRHDVVRDAVLVGMPERRRQELSWSLGVRLLDAVGDDRLEEAAALVRAGVAVGDVGVAIAAAQRAADAAMAGLAPELAVDHLAWVLALPDPPPADVDRVDLLLALGEAQRDAGDWAAGGDAFEAAAEAAEAAGRADQLARAALGFGAGLSGFEVRLRDERQITLLRRAAEALDGTDAVELAYVLARLSVAVYGTDASSEREALARSALDVAERTGDAGALVHALAAWCDVISGPEFVDERLAAADRMIALGRSAGSVELELLGHRFRAVALLEQGAFAAFDAEIGAFAALAGAARPLVRWFVPLWRGLEALLAGRADEATRRSAEAVAIAERAGSENGRILAKSLVLAIVDQTGGDLEPADAAELDEVVPAVRAQPVISGQERGFLLAVAMMRDDDADARTQLAALVGMGFGESDAELLGTLTVCAWAAARFGDREAAAAVVERMRPFAGQWVIDGIGAAVLAAVDEVLAVLDLLVGAPGAADALDAAARAYDDLPAPVLAARARSWVAVIGTATPVVAPAPADRGVLRREGSTWAVSWGGREVRVADAKGVRDCAALLAQPGRELHVLELTGATTSGAGGQAVLDDTAIAAYRQRVVDLHAEVEEAEDANDIGRAGRAAEELDAVLVELQRGLGLGGSSRSIGDEHERARQAVRARIRTAIRRFGAEHPALGRHLEVSIQTGAFCVYRPERPVTWHVEP